VQAIVDTILDQNNVILSRINVKDRGGPGSNHAVNVSILSVALGARMGLGRKFLGELGFAARVHDSGRIGLDPEILGTPLAEADAKALASHETHVARGVKRLLGGRLSDVLLKSINVAFLHHYRFDQTGYPRMVTSKQQDVFTRIVAVADDYDEGTTPGRLYRDALSPSDALRHLLDHGATCWITAAASLTPSWSRPWFTP